MAEKDEVIDGYQLVNLIARGNICHVWEVTPAAGGESLAMKLLLPNYMNDKEQLTVLKTEAKVATLMTHANLMGCKGFVSNKTNSYMLMEYFRSGNLKTELTNDYISVRSRVSRLIEGLCGALDFMHSKGWVHRDVKPDNILTTRGGELKLIDYSLARKFGMFAGKPAAIQGTRTYIAPETIGKKTITPQTDIYSLGVTLYEVLTGRPPFRAKQPNDLLLQHLKEKPTPLDQINPNVTPEMSDLILKLLEKKPADRPKNGAEILMQFRSVQPFKEDVAEVQKRIAMELVEKRKDDIDKASRIDSRADAMSDKPITSSGMPQQKKAVPPPQPIAATPQPPQMAPQQPIQPQPMMPAQQAMPAQPMQPQFIPQPGAMPVAQQPPMMPGQFVMPPGQIPQMQYPQQGIPLDYQQQPQAPMQPTTPPPETAGHVQPLPPQPVPAAQQPVEAVQPSPPSPDETSSPAEGEAPVIPPATRINPQPKLHPSQIGVDAKNLEEMKDLPDFS